MEFLDVVLIQLIGKVSLLLLPPQVNVGKIELRHVHVVIDRIEALVWNAAEFLLDVAKHVGRARSRRTLMQDR